MYAFNTNQVLLKYIMKVLQVSKPESSVEEFQFNTAKYYYIPIFGTLKAHQSCDTVLRDMCDGKALADNPLFGCEGNALQFVAYYDELEVCNPLGVAAHITKWVHFSILWQTFVHNIVQT